MTYIDGLKIHSITLYANLKKLNCELGTLTYKYFNDLSITDRKDAKNIFTENKKYFKFRDLTLPLTLIQRSEKFYEDFISECDDKIHVINIYVNRQENNKHKKNEQLKKELKNNILSSNWTFINPKITGFTLPKTTKGTTIQIGIDTYIFSGMYWTII